MPPRFIDLETAKLDIAAVEKALAEGHPPPDGTTGGSRPITGAVLKAARERNVPSATFQYRIGSQNHHGAIFRLHKLQVDWSKYKPRAPEQREADPQSEPAKFGGSDTDRKLLALQDEVRRLTAALKEAHRAAVDDESIREILGVISAAETKPPQWLEKPKSQGKRSPEVPCTIWSDWHIGEVVNPGEVNGYNEYNLEIAERRIRQLVDSTINICRDHGPGDYPGIVVNLLGDIISGQLHPELAKTDEEEIIPCTLKARDWLVAAFTRLADEFGNVYVACTSGNHGRITPKPEFKRYVYKNFDWLLAQLLIRHFADDKRITFDVPESNEVYYRVFDLRYLAMHGDQMGVKGGDGIIGMLGPIARGEIKVGTQSRVTGRDFDTLLIGHWHQQLWLPRVIVANSIKGFDEYAKNALRAAPSEPSAPLWFVHPVRGVTSRWDVKVEERKPVKRDWVSWPGR